MRPLRNPQPNLTTEAIMEQQNFPISSSPRPSERLRPAQDEVVGLDGEQPDLDGNCDDW